MFGKPEIGWDDVLATKAAAYCKVRGLSGKEMSDQLKSLGIRPKDVEILNKFFDIAKISETAFPILADRVVKTKRSLNEWLNILAERMGKSPASATAEELDAAIADLPEMV
ncbi:MAG: hypothetical protein HC888_07215 [Candidatus Competibacteraceae bacterium]|nr:hypothetical protein [Candidatus Competibacteraceae bacterium]